MKKIFLGLFTITSVISTAQVQLGMSGTYSLSSGDTVLVNSSVTLTAVVKNKGNAPFVGTFTLNVALNNGTITPIATSTSSTPLNPNDSTNVTTTFTAQAGVNGWKVAGNGNTIVVWPISNGIQTLDSLKINLTVIEPAGITDLDKDFFTIYPNPTKEELYIKPTSGLEFDSYTIYDIEAREIEKHDFIEKIEMKHLKPGIYWLVLSMGDKRYKQKVMKE